MDKYIITDLIKFIISPYIGYYEITPICNSFIILHKHRIVKQITKFKSDFVDIITSELIIDNITVNVITNRTATAAHITTITANTRNEKLHGVQSVIFNGKLEEIKSYKNGFAYGRCIEKINDDTSSVTIYCTYYNNNLIGTYKKDAQYYLHKYWINHNGLKEGNYRCYRKYQSSDINNDVYNSCYYINGLREGIEKFFYRDRNIQVIKTYKNDKLNGLYTSYLQDNTIDNIGYYQNNYKHGKWKEEGHDILYYMGDLVDDNKIEKIIL